MLRAQPRAVAACSWPSSSSTCSSTGVGIWGIDIPVAWGFAITNFVWWIGIGHAGTLISAILLLLHQKWRTSINRFAEAMTIFAVMCAGMFPLLHLGRPWFFYWLLPYPNTMGLWPQFRSAAGLGRVRGQHLLHRLAAVLVHGHDPRPGDAARPRRNRAGADRLRHAGAGLAQLGPALAALRIGLPAPGRAGDAAGGFGPLGRQLRLRHVASCRAGTRRSSRPTSSPGPSSPASRWCWCWPSRCATSTGLKDFITINHLDVMGKILLATSLLTSYGYLSEQFMAWYGGERCEHYVYLNRLIGFGQYAVVTWIVFCLQRRRRRRSSGSAGCGATRWCCCIVSLFVLVGMWLERYMIIVHQPAPRLPAVVVGHVPADDLGLPDLLRLDRLVLASCSCCSSGCCR